ncbi:MAG: 1-deoxy-D-xylulose-5-phosphate reductoisomerase [Bryobacterales bacterium]|nr:1-deoxy-D-xylulose-5-phosphate reductoisomerase [Bryobacterales bacterium]
MQSVCLLGSTGSIGQSTLDVIRRSPERYRVRSLVAGRNIRLLTAQIKEFRPCLAVVATAADLANLTSELADEGVPKSEWPELAWGSRARVEAATDGEADFVMSAIVGVAGLEATYEAVRKGKTVGLANKEVLVASGSLVMAAAAEAGTELIPVDSEHNGAHQCLRAGKRHEATRLILTASGGPFRDLPAEKFHTVSPAEALNHPTWKMGQRITIDSATMMNKGFEVIEACWLFGFSADEVDVVIHPQSSVHAMVEYADGSIVAQASTTDMRMPIQYALTYPERCASAVPRMDWSVARTWNFFPPDPVRFPCLRLAFEAQKAGSAASCALNASDEIAVQAFLDGQIAFDEIPQIVEETISAMPGRDPRSIQDVLEIDKEARSVAREAASRRAAKRDTLARA